MCGQPGRPPRNGLLDSLRRLVAITALGVLAPALAEVVDVNPDGVPTEPRFGGRALGISIQPGNNSNVFVASERGGFFRSTDGGTNWSHVDTIPVPLARDILYDPQNANLLIASGRYDGGTVNQGGIWRSTDGGASWSKPATSNPGCSSQASTWGIAIPDDPAFNQNVYVATDCGIAISADSGASWNHVDPCTSSDATFCNASGRYFDVVARVVGGNVQVDVCGDEGVFRSADGGASWSAPDPVSPARAVAGGAFNPCNVATAPNDANTLYLANYSGTSGGFCVSRLMENAAGVTAGGWVDMQVSASNCRDPWVVTHPDQGGDPDLFAVYFGDTQRMRRQVCDRTATPRCATGIGNWPTADAGSHSDTSDIAFDTTLPNGCPLVLTSDGGNATSSDCGTTWDDGNRGLHALDVVTFAGTVNGGGLTDLYAGTQDNGIYVTQDNAVTWTRPAGADGYNVLADRTPPARVFYRICFGCGNSIAGPGLAGAAPFPNPPGTIPTFAVVTQFGPLSYAFVTSDGATPATWSVWVTTDEGASWTQMGPSLPGNPGEIKASGPAATPTFYLRLNVGGLRRIYRLTGAFDATATLALASAGLNFPTSSWDVDPGDPSLLYAADIGLNQVMVSRDGGTSWNPDPALTQRVTANGQFLFSPNLFNSSIVSGIGIDPNSQQILVGTHTAGWYASVDDGATWVPVQGSSGIPRAEEFFFDPDNGEMYAATRGRGIWRIRLEKADLVIGKSAAPDPGEKGESLVYSIEVGNDGPETALAASVSDALPADITFLSASPGCSEAGGVVTCDLGDLASGETRSLEITGEISCAVADGTLLSNSATTTSDTADPDASNNSATADVAVFDTTPPVIESLAVNPGSLWPPNHKLQLVTAEVVVTDSCDPNPACAIVAVASNEPLNGIGDGNTDTDWVLNGDLTAELRAERAGPGSGRSYTLTVECTDASGNTSLPEETTVDVDHDRRG